MLSTPRARKNAFIAAFLALQVLVPLAYYMGDGGPDERFRWRMFSSVRLQRCRVDIHAVNGDRERVINPAKDIQVAWVNILKRYRASVVERYLERVCAAESAGSVRYLRRCVDTDDSALPPLEVTRSCGTGAMATRELSP